MDDLSRVFPINAALKPQEARKVGHCSVFGQVDRPHAPDAASPRDVDQMGHEDHAQTVVLPLVKNGDRDSQAVPSADVLYRLTPTIFSPDASGTTTANAKSRV